MKNHIKIDGTIIQTNKKWSALKLKQREWIYLQLKSKYLTKSEELNKLLNKNEKEEILNSVYEEIQAKGIWIPFSEVKKFFNSRINRLNNLCRNNYLKEKL